MEGVAEADGDPGEPPEDAGVGAEGEAGGAAEVPQAVDGPQHLDGGAGQPPHWQAGQGESQQQQDGEHDW